MSLFKGVPGETGIMPAVCGRPFDVAQLTDESIKNARTHLGLAVVSDEASPIVSARIPSDYDEEYGYLPSSRLLLRDGKQIAVELGAEHNILSVTGDLSQATVDLDGTWRWHGLGGRTDTLRGRVDMLGELYGVQGGHMLLLGLTAAVRACRQLPGQ